jgi:hypothetical protein
VEKIADTNGKKQGAIAFAWHAIDVPGVTKRECR